MSNDVAAEQIHLSDLYHRLDELRERATTRLRDTLADNSTGHQARSQRDSATAHYAHQIAQYDAAENSLCFGRLDFDDSTRRHVGRTGLLDPDGEPVLLDWRSPAARPFYVATVAAPAGVARRRQIQTRLRTVTAVHDEMLTGGAGTGTGHDLTSEAALLDAVSAARTGQMSDIVATIQAEQDAIIRADRSGVLVVDGGPGTGKTAVALHRAAYLLYTHREILASRAVLIVGPNPTFLRYIGRVLPGLGETAVVLATVADLYPGVTATATDTDATAALKGAAGMVDVLTAAVAGRQRVPDGPRWIDTDGQTLLLDPDTVADARARARATGQPHNLARPVFALLVLDALARQVAARIGTDPLGGTNLLSRGDIAEIRADLATDPGVRDALDDLWPVLTPQRFLADLYADPLALELAAPRLTAAQRAALHRPSDRGWTAADVPLLDEAAELLGTRAHSGTSRADEEYARGVLEILSRDVDDDPDILMAYDLIDPERLAGRQVDGDGLTVAERAAADRSWAYGHVIVDEAQELSAMAWRLLMRRCPSRSMTLVGDVAQTSTPAGAAAWGEVLDPYVPDRWRLARLTVNYRTPTEIMDVAARVLGLVDARVTAPRSIRSTGGRPWRLRIATGRLGPEIAGAVHAELAALGEGRLAVLVPGELLGAVRDALPGAATGDGADLTVPVAVLTVRQAKGLEFDTVLVVEPAAILHRSARGAGDLYVALTRATRRLGILHTTELPEPLAALEPLVAVR